ncbi:hypothetical protein [Robbsia sp. KACC 23696]|uniref:hypothetical protein n=1 Tax=Robbsia sp. KACC 23696 TaxID=3149231 RepID=UPI00325C169C
MRSPVLPFSLGPMLSLGIAVSMLAGCQSFGGYAGAVGGVAAAGASANPAVGIGVGIAIRAGSDALLDTIFRRMQRGEQDRIAAQAASLLVGQTAAWEAKQVWPLPSEEGNMQVVADIDNALSPCRVVLFSVLTKKQRQAAAGVAASAAAAPAKPGSGADAASKAAETTETASIQWFQTSVCRRSDGQWKWAQAEPATERWGNLQ